MKKIPTLFKRTFVDHVVTEISPELTPGFEWVLAGEGVATVKWDGASCAIINGEFYKRYDAKHGKPVPDGAIQCEEEPDPVTGHLPCWVKCDRANPGDKWFWAAFENSKPIEDGTYEALGPHFQSNPYHLEQDIIKMGRIKMAEAAEAIRREYEQYPDNDFDIRLVRKYPVYKGETEAQALKRTIIEEKVKKQKATETNDWMKKEMNIEEVDLSDSWIIV